jgi:hypothetical protein
VVPCRLGAAGVCGEGLVSSEQLREVLKRQREELEAACNDDWKPFIEEKIKMIMRALYSLEVDL